MDAFMFHEMNRAKSKIDFARRAIERTKSIRVAVNEMRPSLGAYAAIGKTLPEYRALQRFAELKCENLIRDKELELKSFTAKEGEPEIEFFKRRRVVAVQFMDIDVFSLRGNFPSLYTKAMSMLKPYL